MRTTHPYGSWPSPLSAADVAGSSTGLTDLAVDGTDLLWLQTLPDEGNRHAVMRRRADGTIAEVSPPGFDARTRVHEYGGGALGAGHGVVLASSWADHRVHRLHVDGTTTPVTPEPASPAGIRWAAMTPMPGGTTFLAVRETHGPDRSRDAKGIHGHDEAVNELVAVSLDTGDTTVLVSGPDFIGGPWIDPTGTHVAWLQWDHPDMPWDTAELWVGELAAAPSTGLSLANAQQVAGGRRSDGTATSVADACWLDDERLAFTVDPDGWWNVHVRQADGVVRLQDEQLESGLPRWTSRGNGIARAGDDVVVVTVADAGEHLRQVSSDVATTTAQPLPLQGVSAVNEVVAIDGGLAAVVGGPAMPWAIWHVDLATGHHAVWVDTGDHPAAAIGSLPQPITFPTTGDAIAHALYYAPTPPAGVAVPADELPPLIVLSHGGPTSAARTQLHTTAQYWTSRGIAVVDVNYRGSTGYGRAYRDSLLGSWGLHDRDDCIAAAAYLAAEGLADPDRLIIEGGSAGGYTTLLALCTSDAFAAGGSLYGVADLRALAEHTHKFESRYLDHLVGRWPADEATYVERSPITHVDRLRTPMIVLQGDEDAVVPPAQAEVIVAALRERGLTHAYLLFEGEQHGFRRPASIIRALEARLAFYGHVLGFEPADDVALPELVDGS